MSRLSDLLRELRQTQPRLARDIQREVAALADRRAFGLNFERHVPEAVDLPGRIVRKRDKVRTLPPRGKGPTESDERLWRVTAIDRSAGTATLRSLTAPDLDFEYPCAEYEDSGHETVSAPLDDIVVVAEFRDPIYPGLVSTGKVERGGQKPYHTVINAENFHALQTLLFTHRGMVDCIYVDPPYNSGARDWKYNNDYVEKDDLYRHSKWLAFLERRLILARELLNPERSVLIVTIDEKEYLRLGLLLEQVFPDGKFQMVSSVINPKGTGRANEMLRVNEFIFFIWFGDAELGAFEAEDQEEDVVAWETMRRRNLASRRGRRGKGACGPNQFYPIYVNQESGFIEAIGDPLPETTRVNESPQREGCVAVFPIRPDGTEMNWSLTAETCRLRWKDGYVRAGRHDPGKPQKYIIQFLLGGAITAIESGDAEVIGRGEDGSVEARYVVVKSKTPTTQWNFRSHNAEHNGTNLLKSILPDRTFPFPKSLYAVEDALRLFVGNNQDAVVLDFFSGSGTTAHAVMRLNRQDGGRRKCISVTNNEVAAEERKALSVKGFRAGDLEWEKWGICEYITKPRIKAAITGQTPDGKPIKGDYRFVDEFPIANGLEENVEFFTLTYEGPLRVSSHREFLKIAPLLWIRAGSCGRRIDDISEGWDVAEYYGVLEDLDRAEDFLEAIASGEEIAIAYIVTDEERLFESIAQELPSQVEPVRLYEAYLRNFEIESGRGSL